MKKQFQFEGGRLGRSAAQHQISCCIAVLCDATQYNEKYCSRHILFHCIADIKLPSDPQNIPLCMVDMMAHFCNTGLCTGSEQNAIAEVTLHHNTHQQYAQKLRSNAILLLKAECSHSGCEPKLNADTQWASGSLQNALYSVQCVLHFANNFTICKVCISHRARNLEMKMFFCQNLLHLPDILYQS